MPDIGHIVEPEEIMAYLDGELPSARAAAAMNHLERCTECRNLAADLRRLSQEMTAWQVSPPREMAPPREPMRRVVASRMRVPAYAAAVFAVCAAIALLIFVTSRGRREAATANQLSLDGPLLPDVARYVPAPALPPQATPAAARVSPPAPTVSEPMIERTASLDLAARDFDGLRSRMDAILSARHGYIGELTLNTPPQAARSLSATLRVPAAALDATLADLRQLGQVQSESQKGDDVTRQYADLTARLANARNTEQRLTEILAQRTGKLSDVLEVERELARVRGEIEQMDAERRVTAGQVAFAVIQFSAAENYHAQLHLSPDSTLARLRNAAVDGYKNLAGGLVDAATIFIRYGPSVLLWLAIIYFAARWILRRRKLRGEP